MSTGGVLMNKRGLIGVALVGGWAAMAGSLGAVSASGDPLFDTETLEAVRQNESLWDFRDALAPVPEDIVEGPLRPETVDLGVLADAGEAVRNVLQPWIAGPDIEKSFTLLRVREKTIPPCIIDAALLRQDTQDASLFIRQDETHVLVVYRGTKPSDAAPDELVLQTAIRILRLPPGAALQLTPSRMPVSLPIERGLREIALKGSKRLWWGFLRYPPLEEAVDSSRKDRPKDAWLGQIRVLTDGRAVCFMIRDTHKAPLGPRPRFVPQRRFTKAPPPNRTPTSAAATRGLPRNPPTPLWQGIVPPSQMQRDR
jgi:hypothetical protein